MVHRDIGKCLVLAGALAAMVGCGPNYEEMETLLAMERNNIQNYSQMVERTVGAAPSGNAGAAAHTAYQMKGFAMMFMLPDMRPNTLETVLNYEYRRQQLIQGWVTLGFNNPLTNALAQKWAGGGSGGNSVKIVARDEGSISNIDMTAGSKSPFVAGDDNVTGIGSTQASDEGMAAQDDGQIQTGDGQQTGLGTDPPFLPGFNQESAGGEGDGSTGGSGPTFDSSTGLDSDI